MIRCANAHAKPVCWQHDIVHEFWRHRARVLATRHRAREHVQVCPKTWAVRARHDVASGGVKRDLLRSKWYLFRSKRDEILTRLVCVYAWVVGGGMGGMGGWVGGWGCGCVWAYENREHSTDPAQQNFWRDWVRDLWQGDDISVKDKKSVWEKCLKKMKTTCKKHSDETWCEIYGKVSSLWMNVCVCWERERESARDCVFIHVYIHVHSRV
jgi:hypothetical protein